MDKIRVIKGSLDCFTDGWLALLPILGIAAAVHAMFEYRKVRKEMQQGRLARVDLGNVACYVENLEHARETWNPAEKYLVVGFILAWCGLLLSLAEIGALFALALRMVERS